MIEELKELKILINARYPVIYIVSSEEERILNMISSIANDTPIWVWSYSRGLREFEKKVTTNRGEIITRYTDVVDLDTIEPNNMLEKIRDIKKKGLFVLCDFHPWMNSDERAIVRDLRETAINFKALHKNIIIISPILKIPIELEKEVVVIDFPLPDVEEISDIYESVRDKMSKSTYKKLVDLNGNKEYILRALTGITHAGIKHVLHKTLVKDKGFNIETIIGEKQQIIKKSGMLEYYHSQEGLGIVGGLDIYKEWIKQRRLAFSDKAREFGLQPPRGVLITGISGCGKSLTAKCTAHDWKFPLIRVDMGSMFGGLVGESEANMRQTFRLLEACAPCIAWFDEIEKGFSGVGSSNMSDGGTTARVFGSFLTWMEENKKSVFVIATANDITQLPPEFMRKGRFDEIFFVDLPNEIERKEIFSIHLKKRNRKTSKFDLHALVSESEQFTGAEIESVIKSALFTAYSNEDELSTDYIVSEINKTTPLAKTMSTQIEFMRKQAGTHIRLASSPMVLEDGEITINIEED